MTITISLRVIVVLVVALAAVAAAAIALVPVYVAGVASVQQTALLLRREVAARLSAHVAAFFRAPMQLTESLADYSELGVMNVANWTTMVKPLVLAAQRSHVVSAFVFNGGGMVGVIGGGAFLNHIRSDMVSEWYPTRRSPDVGISAMVSNDTTHDTRELPWYPHMFQQQSWLGFVLTDTLGVAGDAAMAMTSLPVYNSSGLVHGAFSIGVSTGVLGAFLANVTVAETGRVLLVQTGPRTILGANFGGEALVRVDAAGAKRIARLEDWTADPVLVSVVGALSADRIFTAALPFTADVGDGTDRVCVDIVGVTDEWGLDLRIIVMTPEIDFLASLYREANVGVGSAAAAVVVLMLLAGALAFALLRPLVGVERMMVDGANFTADGAVACKADRSPMAEVRAIQTAFEQLQRQLAAVRPYVPMSVLATLDSDAVFDDGSPVESARGSAAGSQSGSVHRGSQLRSSSRAASYRVGRSHINHMAASIRSGSDSGASGSTAYVSPVGAVRVLNVAIGLVSRRIAVLAFNLRGFHALAGAKTADAVALQAAVQAAVEQAATDSGGVVDSFHGDRAVVSYNAVTPVASAAVSAAIAALRLEATLRGGAIANYGGCSMGLASGAANVGNIGSPSSRRFCIVGNVYNQAVALERMSRQHAVATLIAHAMAQTIEPDVVVRHVDVLQLPGTPKPTPIATLVVPKDRANEEWLYAGERQQPAAEVAAVNAVFEMYASGDAVRAAALCAALPETVERRGAIAAMCAMPFDTYASRQGLFYSEAYAFPDRRVVK
jgi:hypothetical protein